MNKNIAILLGVVIVIPLVIGIFFTTHKSTKSSQSQKAKSTAQNTPSAPTSIPTPTYEDITVPGLQQFNVTGNEFTFTPSTITAKAGKPVQLVFKNAGKYPHNLTIPDLHLHTDTLQPDGVGYVSFLPKTPGTYTFICTVPGHADKGMKGTIIIE